MLTRRFLMVLGGFLLIAPPAARAAVLTFAMEGPITFKDDPVGLLDFAEVGDRVVYTFSFDTDAPDTHGAPTLAVYDGIASSVLVGDRQLSSGQPLISIQEHDLFQVFSDVAMPEGVSRIAFTLHDRDLVAILTKALPEEPYGLEPFEDKEFDFVLDMPPVPPDTIFTRFEFYGDIDRFYIVPEPATAVLVCLGLTAVIRKRR